jgi:hypothetical protein
MMKLVVYDCEILNVIPPKEGGMPLPGVKFCKGWGDHAGMGISVICAYVWGEGYRVFLEDNMDEFATLAASDSTILAGFNNHSFDDKLIIACLPAVAYAPRATDAGRFPEHRSWDLAREVRRAKGMNPDAPGGGTGGLDGLARANFLDGKKSTANAPLDWQQGRRGKVIDQCLLDVMLTKRLVELALNSNLRDFETGRKLPVNFDVLRAAVDILG